MGVTVVKPIHPSLPSANAVLASDKLGRGGNGGSGDQTLYDIGWNLSSGEVVKEAGVIDAVNNGASERTSNLAIESRKTVRRLGRVLSSVEDGRASWNSSGPKLGTRDENWPQKTSLCSAVGSRAGSGRFGREKRGIDQGGKAWQNLFIPRTPDHLSTARRFPIFSNTPTTVLGACETW